MCKPLAFDKLLYSSDKASINLVSLRDSLRRHAVADGIVLMECATHFVGRNRMLKIILYEVLRTKADSTIAWRLKCCV